MCITRLVNRVRKRHGGGIHDSQTQFGLLHQELAGGFFTISATWEPRVSMNSYKRWNYKDGIEN